MISSLMKKRSSVRHFDSKPISYVNIKKILESARLSPSIGNLQPWVFGAITEKAIIKSISEYSYNQIWLKTAPLLVVLCSDVSDTDEHMKNITYKRFPALESEISKLDPNLYSSICSTEHQTKIPGSIMMLQALELGIYSTWTTYFNVPKMKEILNLPEHLLPSEIIAFGYPKKDIKLTSKKDFADIIFYNTFCEIKE
jgi:nitroreductase